MDYQYPISVKVIYRYFRVFNSLPRIIPMIGLLLVLQWVMYRQLTILYVEDGNVFSPQYKVFSIPEEQDIRSTYDDVEKQVRPLKRILLRSKWLENWETDFGLGQVGFSNLGCEVESCYLTSNITEVTAKEWDAVIYDWQEENTLKLLRGRRSPKTYFIYYSTERPIPNLLRYYINKNKLNSIFNITMTYRRDSDIVVPYFQVERQPRKSLEYSAGVNFAKDKTAIAAQFVSHCGAISDRDNLTASIQKYIPVDIYGKCGPFDCRKENRVRCDNMLGEKYKFYFSFENTLCIDYITEKLSRAYLFSVVPVVYGLSYETMHLPPHSFIDVMDFASTKELADYLLYLDKNDTAYNEYFAWKTDYKVTFGIRYQSMCELCEFLHRAEDFENNPFLYEEDFFQNKEVIVPKPKTKSKIRMPQASFVHKNVFVKGNRKEYKNITEWHIKDVCIKPNEDTNFMKFVYDL